MIWPRNQRFATFLVYISVLVFFQTVAVVVSANDTGTKIQILFGNLCLSGYSEQWKELEANA